MWKIGVNTQIWVDGFSARDVHLVTKAAELGFDAVEMAFSPTQSEPFPAADVAALAKEHGLRTSLAGALSESQDITSSDPAAIAAAMRYFESAIEVSRTIGAEMICGPLYGPLFRRRVLSAEQRHAERINAARVLRRVADMAEDIGAKIGLETLNRWESDLVNLVGHALEIVDEVGSPALGVHLDTHHMHIEEPSLSDAIHLAGDKTVHFHASECNRGIPGTGQVHWGEAYQALTDIDYKGLIVVEGFNPRIPEMAKSAHLWREFAKDADEYAERSAEFLRRFVSGALAPGRSDASVSSS